MTLSYPKGIYLIIVYIAIHRSVWVGPRSFYTCNSTMIDRLRSCEVVHVFDKTPLQRTQGWCYKKDCPARQYPGIPTPVVNMETWIVLQHRSMREAM